MIRSSPSAVWFRCGAGRGVGLGHVSRCLALAELFEDVAGVKASFMLSSASERALAMIRGAGFVCAGRPSRPAHHDFAALARRLRDDDLVVIDDYGLSPDYVRSLKGIANCRVLVVDDHNRWDDDQVDWVLAFPLIAAAMRYRHTHAFRGPQYTPLRRAFRAGVAAETDEGTCLIALGGLATPPLLRWVVTEASRFYPRLRVARSAARGGAPPPAAPSCRVELLSALPDLAAEIARAAVCVCTGGFAKYECVSLGKPSVVIDLTDLEHRDSLLLQQRGLLAGMVAAMDTRRLDAILLSLESAPRRAALAAGLREAGFGSRTGDMAAQIMGMA